MSNLFSVTAAAQLLGISTKTIRRWDLKGRIVQELQAVASKRQ